MISKVLDYIFIGDAFSNKEVVIRQYKIKTILTLSSEPIEKQLPELDYKFIYMLDTEDQNIFTTNILKISLDLIEECYNNNHSILVHCESGISRSSTIIAAFLMKLKHWSCHDSLEFLKSKHSISRPNNSFIKQLEIFEKVGLITDLIELKKSAIFRDFMACNKYLFQSNDNTCKYTMDESYLLSSKKYSCKKCRTNLFFDFNLLQHSSAESELICEFGYLITPMVWMDLSELKGKINCPGCNIKLGTFNWDGHHCIQYKEGQKCGKYIQPWIHIQNGKADIFNIKI